MAAIAISLPSRTTNICRSIRNPNFIHRYSSSSSSSSTSDPPIENPTEKPNTPAPSQSQSRSSSFSSLFSDVKASLKQQDPSQSQFQRPPRTPFSLSSTPTEKPSTVASLDEIRKNLADFRRRSAVPPASGDNSSPSTPPRPSQPISFQELYKRNVIRKTHESNSTDSTNSVEFSFQGIRESLRQLKNKQPEGGLNKGNETTPRSRFTDGLLRPANSTNLFAKTDSLPASVFRKETEKKPESAASKTEFVKMYTYGELGEKLRKLRPEEAKKKGDKWFSLAELNGRLMKLREMEQKESESRIGGVSFTDLRESLMKLKLSEEDRAKKNTVHGLDMLSQLDGTRNYMLSPPKENLVEKYFHPDHMSSAEKLKIELKKVRDEFKMSESDCGSARVQVAQLTTKIKHLSTALHKKDKHSRKGLQAMVQKRKKLLKYLRRTDWDSYCFVLSKLGLRDNPDYKN